MLRLWMLGAALVAIGLVVFVVAVAQLDLRMLPIAAVLCAAGLGIVLWVLVRRSLRRTAADRERLHGKASALRAASDGAGGSRLRGSTVTILAIVIAAVVVVCITLL